jgi:hypothetical protein
VKRLADKPFVLLGVHGLDYAPEKLAEVMAKENLEWRSWTSRATANKWSARGIPTFYVIDAKGVIRAKWVGYPGAKAIDGALERLIEETERNAPK